MRGKKLDLKGKKFNRLLAVSPINEKNRSGIIWKFLCDCGKEHYAAGTLVYRGKIKSCGCLLKEKVKERRSLPTGEAAINRLINRYKQNAKAKNLLWKINKRDFINITSSCCFYCGIPPHQISYEKDLNGGYLHNGIDRLDNSKGYLLENCVPCCSTCNLAKRQQTPKEFISWIIRVHKNIINNSNLMKIVSQF